MRGLALCRRFRPNTMSSLVRHFASDGDFVDRDTATQGAMHSFVQAAHEKREGQTDSSKPWIKARRKSEGVGVETKTRSPSSKKDPLEEPDFDDSDNDIDEETRREIDLVANYDHETDLSKMNKDDYFKVSDSENDESIADLQYLLREAQQIQDTIRKEEDEIARALGEAPGIYEEEFGATAGDGEGGRRGRSMKKMTEKEEEESHRREMKAIERAANGNAEAGVAPEEISMLMDTNYFQREAKKGLGFDNTDLDKFDAFLGSVLMEAAKTQSGTVRGVMPVDENDSTMKSKKSRRNRIPNPRTTKQLVRAVTPQIKSVAPETDGYKVACEAWEVLSKNPYYTQQDKIEMCNYLAKEYDYIMGDEGLYDEDKLAALSLVNGGKDSKGKIYGSRLSNQQIENEIIWNSNFRPGIELIEQEQIESQKKDEENRARTILSKQASTDWSVEAVVDEDDLFK